MSERVVIMGAAGRDFHNFLTHYRSRADCRVVAFTAEQIPGIDDRVFPARLAGEGYPEGIPIFPEQKLESIVSEFDATRVCLAYSDLSHDSVMVKASRVLAAGADFELLGRDVYVASSCPTVAVCAVRTGCGKSQTARAIGEILRRQHRKPVAIRHSMPYGDDLTRQTCQRFGSVDDFAEHHTTIEEEEEYQPWLDHGFPVFAGFDYEAIVAAAQREGDVLVFDGGNNDLPMIRPSLWITVLDPHRAGHELAFYPGLVNLLRADVVVINKIDSASSAAVDRVRRNVEQHNPGARIVLARSEITVEDGDSIRGKRCAVIGDGPTLTHGGMTFGADSLAVRAHGGEIVDPRAHLVGAIAEAFDRYSHLDREIPAMGYGDQQIRDLEATLRAIPCDAIVDGSPARLERLVKAERPWFNVSYELGSDAVEQLEEILGDAGLFDARR